MDENVLFRGMSDVCTTDALTTYLGFEKLVEGRLQRDCGASITDFYVLCVLHDTGERSVKSLSDTLELRYTTIAESVKRLEAKLGVSKRSDGSDERKNQIRITAIGDDLYHEMDAALVSLVGSVWEGVPKDTRNKALLGYASFLSSIGKNRLLNGMIRGDSAFVVTLAEMTRVLTKICRGSGLTAPQARIVVLLGEADAPLRPGCIASALAMQPSTVSRSIKSLRASGLLERAPARSRRELPVSLSARGEEAARDLRGHIGLALDRRFGTCSESREILDDAASMLAEKLRSSF